MSSSLFKSGYSLYLAIMALPLGVLLIYFSFFTEQKPLYMHINPQMRNIEHRIYATGVLSGRDEVDVGAQVSGQIKEIYVHIGQKVKKGDPLCLIDPKTQETKLKSAMAQERLAKAQLKAQLSELRRLESDKKRKDELKKIDAVSQKVYEETRAAYNVAQARVEELEAMLAKAVLETENARTNLEYTHISAPVDGTVYAIPVKLGQTVNASQSAPTLIKLANLDSMILEAEISEADVVKIKEGMSGRFTILGLPGHYFKAILESIDLAPKSAQEASSSNSMQSGASGSQAVYYNALLDVDNNDMTLRLDMTAQVEILVDGVENALSIPLSALRSDDFTGSGTVYVLENDIVQERKVVLGLRDEQYVQIKSGLDTDDMVVIGDDVKSSIDDAMKKVRSRRIF